ncbi:MAG: hypothetical protein K5669_02425 [Lachnospiraceae bacterium]|nr:hypothetical protein [Lachnospiraceae bacterium]
MWNTVVSHLSSYIGWGLIIVYYLVALVYLFITEKRKERRIVFIYMPMAVLLIFINPLTAMAMKKYADDEVYYRLLWMLPVTITIADAACEAVIRLRGKAKVLVAAGMLFLIILGGRLIYTDDRFSIAENEYHVPQEVADICDEIVIPGREVRAAFPAEYLVYVRQYTALVVMPYGWDDLYVYGTDGSSTHLREELEKPTVSAEKMATEADNLSCHYIILSEDKPISGNPADYGMEEYSHVDGYVIYKNLSMDFTDPYA